MNNSTQQEGRLRAGIEIINLDRHSEDYDILINFLDRMNFNYTVEDEPVSVEPEGMKAKFAAHLGLKPGEELDTRDAYAVEWVLKNIV